MPVRAMLSQKTVICILFVLATYVCINGVLYLQFNVLVYDEAWFICCEYFEKSTNYLGYGYLYWLFIGLIESRLALRLLALLAMISVLFSLYAFTKRNGNFEERGTKAILLWLTFPAAWWYGKLISPELYCLALGTIGLAMALSAREDRRRVTHAGVLLMGVSAGIKINFALFGVFYYLYVLFLVIEKSDFETIFKNSLYRLRLEVMGLCYIIGFVIGSPSLLWQPQTFIKNLMLHSTPEISWGNIKYFYSSSVGTFWETVILPSISWFSLSIPAFIILVFLAVLGKIRFTDKPLLYAFLVTATVFVFTILKSKIYFSWYAYPLISLFLFVFCTVNISKRAFVIVIAVNIICNSPVIFAQITDKAIAIKNYRNRYEHRQFVDAIDRTFVQRFANREKLISLNPPEGSVIIDIENHLAAKVPIRVPTLIVVSRIMIIGNGDTIYHRIRETFNEDKVIRFKERLSALAVENGSEIITFGAYKGVHIFGYIPNDAKN